MLLPCRPLPYPTLPYSTARTNALPVSVCRPTVAVLLQKAYEIFDSTCPVLARLRLFSTCDTPGIFSQPHTGGEAGAVLYYRLLIVRACPRDFARAGRCTQIRYLPDTAAACCTEYDMYVYLVHMYDRCWVFLRSRFDTSSTQYTRSCTDCTPQILL